MNLHEVNKNSVNHLLPKVTERCMKPCAQNVMKIGLAAQVMRNTVATAISTLVTIHKSNCTVAFESSKLYQQWYVVQLFMTVAKIVP